jgi:hypothetical protein
MKLWGVLVSLKREEGESGGKCFHPGLGGKDMWIERMLLGVKGNEWL